MSTISSFLDEDIGDLDLEQLESLSAKLNSTLAADEKMLQSDAELLPMQLKELIDSANIPDLAGLDVEARELYGEVKKQYQDIKTIHHSTKQLQCNLVAVHVVETYTQLASEMENKSQLARVAVEQPSEQTIPAFVRLVEMHQRIKYLTELSATSSMLVNPNGDRSPFHLDRIFRALVQTLYPHVRDIAVRHFRQQLSALGWPKPIRNSSGGATGALAPSESELRSWMAAVRQLMQLQAVVDPVLPQPSSSSSSAAATVSEKSTRIVAANRSVVDDEEDDKFEDDEYDEDDDVEEEDLPTQCRSDMSASAQSSSVHKTVSHGAPLLPCLNPAHAAEPSESLEGKHSADDYEFTSSSQSSSKIPKSKPSSEFKPPAVCFPPVSIFSDPLPPSDNTSSCVSPPFPSSSSSSSSSLHHLQSMFRPRSWAVQLLVEPLITRFRHHFVGDPRPQSTNRLERPEWLTSFLLDAIQQHAPLIRQHVDPPAREYLSSAHIEPAVEFVWALVGFLDLKLRADWTHVRAAPTPLYRHWIDQLLLFCAQLSQLCDSMLRPLHLPLPSQSLAIIPAILQSDAVQRWLEVDEEYVTSRMVDILRDADGWSRAFDDSSLAGSDEDFCVRAITTGRILSSMIDPLDESSDHSQTIWFCSRNSDALLTVLDALTQRWRRLPAVGAARTFSDRLQRRPLDEFEQHARQSLKDCFSALNLPWSMFADSSVIDMSVHNGDAWCRFAQMINSCFHVASTLHAWNHDMLFVRLHFAVEYDLPSDFPLAAIDRHPDFAAFARTCTDSSYGGQLPSESVSSSLSHHLHPHLHKTLQSESASSSSSSSSSSSLLSSSSTLWDTDLPSTHVFESDGFWQAHAHAFVMLVNEHVAALVGLILTKFEKGLGAYRRRGHMWRDADDDDCQDDGFDHDSSSSSSSSSSFDVLAWFARTCAGGLTISPLLSEPLSLLSAQLSHVARTLHPTLFSDLWHRLVDKIDAHIYHQVVENHHFSSAGRLQFCVDTAALVSLFQPFASHHQHQVSSSSSRSQHALFRFRFLHDVLTVMATWPESDWVRFRLQRSSSSHHHVDQNGDDGHSSSSSSASLSSKPSQSSHDRFSTDELGQIFASQGIRTLRVEAVRALLRHLQLNSEGATSSAAYDDS